MAQNTFLPPELNKRVVSLDVFRGFIMFTMLIGTFGLKELAHYPVAGFVYNQLTHAPWRGFHFEDVILPSFLFIIGVAMALSTSKRRSQGEDNKKKLRHAVRRSAALFLMGFLLSWISARKPYFGAGVLQILAISYFFAYLFIEKSIKVQYSIFAVLLFIYWFFIFIVPVPEAGRNSYVLYKNLVYYLDDIIIGSATRWGYLYTIITSIAVVVYGSIIGKILLNRSSNKEFMKMLAILGTAGVVAGLALNPVIPIIKRMFTPSYTLFTCGLVTLMLLGFFWLIDIKGHVKWSFPFIVFGANSIFVYMLNMLFSSWLMEKGGIFIAPLEPFIGAWASPATHLLRMLALWLVCFWLYRRKLFFKI
ncbi:acyltransferase family protein [Candidatus Latescibacterota bacterium]